MVQKVRDAFLQRDDMRTQMEEAFTAKEAVRAVTASVCVSSKLFHLSEC